MKSRTGWNSFQGISGNGDDEYGFTALPAGAHLIGFWYESPEECDEYFEDGILQLPDWGGLGEIAAFLASSGGKIYITSSLDFGACLGANSYVSVRCIKD